MLKLLFVYISITFRAQNSFFTVQYEKLYAKRLRFYQSVYSRQISKQLRFDKIEIVSDKKSSRAIYK